MTANLLQPEKIEIVDFKIIKGQINSPFDFEEEKIQSHNFNVNFELGFNPEKLIKADFSVNVASKSEKEDSEEAIGAFSFVYVFHVDNIEELTKIVRRQYSYHTSCIRKCFSCHYLLNIKRNINDSFSRYRFA